MAAASGTSAAAGGVLQLDTSELVLDIPAKVSKESIPIAAVLAGTYKDDVLCFVPACQARKHHYSGAASTLTPASAVAKPSKRASSGSTAHKRMQMLLAMHEAMQTASGGRKRARLDDALLAHPSIMRMILEEDEDEDETSDEEHSASLQSKHPSKAPASNGFDAEAFFKSKKPAQIAAVARFFATSSPEVGPSCIRLDSGGEIVPCPNPSTRTILYVFGKSGSGKSTLASKFAAQWQGLFPKKPIYRFSRVASDKSTDGLENLQNMPVDSSIIGENINSDDFAKDSLVIFDDCDTLPDKTKIAVQKIRDDLLETGRHRNISVIVTSHLGSNGADTRRVLNECHYIITFPQGVGPKGFHYVLTEYAGLRPDVVERLRHLPSRWIGIRMHYPPAVLFNRGVLSMQHPFLI